MNATDIAQAAGATQANTKDKDQTKSIEQIHRENIELMTNIKKNRTSFCDSVGGC